MQKEILLLGRKINWIITKINGDILKENYRITQNKSGDWIFFWLKNYISSSWIRENLIFKFFFALLFFQKTKNKEGGSRKGNLLVEIFVVVVALFSFHCDDCLRIMRLVHACVLWSVFGCHLFSAVSAADFTRFSILCVPNGLPHCPGWVSLLKKSVNSGNRLVFWK